MKKLSAILLGVLLAIVGAASAQTSGLPSRPRFQAIGVGTTPGAGGQLLTLRSASSPYILLSNSAAAADSKNVYFQANGGDITLGFCNDAIGACAGVITATRSAGTNTASALNLAATAVTANGAPIPTQTSGNFVASFTDACTTTPTITFGYVAIGNHVTLQIKSRSGFPCTGDVVQFQTSGAPLPAALRPTTNSPRSPLLPECTDNSVVGGCSISLGTSGEISFLKVSTAFAYVGWTAAGSRDAPAVGMTFSYYLTNP